MFGIILILYLIFLRKKHPHINLKRLGKAWNEHSTLTLRLNFQEKKIVAKPRFSWVYFVFSILFCLLRLLLGKFCIDMCCLFHENTWDLPSVTFHIDTSHFFCSAKQMIGFYMQRKTRLKWVNKSQWKYESLIGSEGNNQKQPIFNIYKFLCWKLLVVFHILTFLVH